MYRDVITTHAKSLLIHSLKAISKINFLPGDLMTDNRERFIFSVQLLVIVINFSRTYRISNFHNIHLKTYVFYVTDYLKRNVCEYLSTSTNIKCLHFLQQDSHYYQVHSCCLHCYLLLQRLTMSQEYKTSDKMK